MDKRNTPNASSSRAKRPFKPGAKKYPYRKPNEDGWLWGRHAVTAALDNPKRGTPLSLLATEEAQKHWQPNWPKPKTVNRTSIDNTLPRDAVHQGMAVKYKPLAGVDLQKLISPAEGCLLVLDQITDPHNVGALFRSATAFGVRGIITQDRHTPVLAGTLAKAAVGTIEQTPHCRVTNISRALETAREAGWRVIGLDAGEHATPLAETVNDKPTILVMGSEGKGLRPLVQEHCDATAFIPMADGVESLNVSVAAGIALYETTRTR